MRYLPAFRLAVTVAAVTLMCTAVLLWGVENHFVATGVVLIVGMIGVLTFAGTPRE